MKLVEECVLLDTGGAGESDAVVQALSEIRRAIDLVRWPPGTRHFYIFPESGKGRGQGNGVVPIKSEFMAAIRAMGWGREVPFPVAAASDGSAFGDMDASKSFGTDLFLVEWETGNISSSHRSLNKAAIGLVAREITGAVVIVPSAKLAPFLTDRIGNIRELRSYFSLWNSVQVERGYLAVFCVEQDGVSIDVPRIPKGTDGRATN